MNFIKPKYEIIKSESCNKDIENAARLCYKSENFITETSADKLVSHLIKSKHYSMLEFGTVYITIKVGTPAIDDKYLEKMDIIYKLDKNPYTKINYDDGEYEKVAYITTNMRVLKEMENADRISPYITSSSPKHHKRYTVKFTTSIGIVREIIRHRKFSFANESTRYCNYGNDNKFDGITFIYPTWIDLPEGKFSIKNIGQYQIGDEGISSDSLSESQRNFLLSCMESETVYLNMIEEGLKPQQARDILPLATKSELMMCGFVDDWLDFFNKRTSIIAETGTPHPDLSVLVDKLYKEFIINGFINCNNE